MSCSDGTIVAFTDKIWMMIALVFIGLKPLEKPSDDKRTIVKPVPPNHRGECCCALMYALNRARQRDGGGGGLAFCFRVHKNENFWLRFWLLYYVIVSYAEILRFCKKQIFWSGPYWVLRLNGKKKNFSGRMAKNFLFVKSYMTLLYLLIIGFPCAQLYS